LNLRRGENFLFFFYFFYFFLFLLVEKEILRKPMTSALSDQGKITELPSTEVDDSASLLVAVPSADASVSVNHGAFDDSTEYQQSNQANGSASSPSLSNQVLQKKAPQQLSKVPAFLSKLYELSLRGLYCWDLG
jgi:hypothetical protein